MIPLAIRRKRGDGDPYRAYLSLLAPMEGANNSTAFADYSPISHSLTAAGDAKISDAQSKWGNGSGLFDGNGDYVSLPAHASLNLGTNIFYIGCWVYPLALANAFGSILSSNHATWQSGAAAFNFGQNSKFRLSCFLFSAAIESTVNLDLNMWQYLVATRVGNQFALYKNGSACGAGTQTAAVNFASNTAVRIGGNSWDGANGYANAHLQDLRVYKGFVPDPTAVPTRRAATN
ncbi:MAG: LamG domain-containing protein [Candidatus Competibacter sp.]